MSNTAEPTEVDNAITPKTSGLAIASFIMGLLSFCGLAPLLLYPAIVFGVVALVKINRSNGTLKGQWMAIWGIVVPAIILPLTMVILLPILNTHKSTVYRIACGNNLKDIRFALSVYVRDYQGKLPDGNNWCDVLINEADVSPKSFICPASETVTGKSCYAMNRNAAGQVLDDLPPDMVLLFETNAVSQTGLRWNLASGPEDLTTDHHEGKGCNILFADGSIEFVPPDSISSLRWKADEQKGNQ